MPLAPARKPNPDHTTEWDDHAMMARAQRAALKRAASGKRRRVDPCTIDRIYSADEWEFAVAMRAYILTSGRKFPAAVVAGSLSFEPIKVLLPMQESIVSGTSDLATVSFTDAAGNPVTVDPAAVTWASSAPAVATVVPVAGTLTATVAALTVGTTTVTATDGAVVASATVSVTAGARRRGAAAAVRAKEFTWDRTGDGVAKVLRRLGKAQGEWPPKPEPVSTLVETPPLLTRMATAAKAAVTFVASGFELLPESDVSARLLICNGNGTDIPRCEQRTPLGLCAGCGCLLIAKARLPHEVCPLDKWPKREPTP